MNKELFYDYITALSRHVLGIKNSENYETIRKLAELGQVNAISNYYDLQPENVKNKVVDSHIVDYYSLRQDSKDWLWEIALAHSMKDLRRKYLEDIAENGGPDKRGYSVISHNRSAEVAYYAAEEMYDYFQLSGNMFALETSMEIKENIGFKNYLSDKIKVKRGLGKLFKKNPDDPEIAFYFAKCLCYFGSTKTQKQAAIKIFENLAKREYSKTFREYDKNSDVENTKSDERSL